MINASVCVCERDPHRVAGMSSNFVSTFPGYSGGLLNTVIHIDANTDVADRADSLHAN